MARQSIAQPTYPAQGNTSWKTPLETILEALRGGVNNTDNYNDPRTPAYNDRGAWAANTAYAVGDVVTRGGLRYQATTAFTSGATFNPLNWGPFFGITINGSGPDSSGNFTVSGSGAASPAVASTRFVAGQAYGAVILVGATSNATPTEGVPTFRREVAGRALPTGTNLVASVNVNSAGSTGSAYRPSVYKMDPSTLTLTLVADFGQIDTSSGTNAWKDSAATATLVDIAVGDYLMVGGTVQGTATTRATLQLVFGYDGFFPISKSSNARSQGLIASTNTNQSAAAASYPALGQAGALTVLQSASASIVHVLLTAQS